MGIMLSCCALDAAFGIAAKSISCLCLVLPWSRSTSARFVTAIVFFLFSLIAYAIHSWTKPILYPPILDVVCGEACYRFYSVYRLTAGLAAGYAILSLSLIGVKDSENPRSIIQDGFWPLKLAGFAGLIFLAFWKVPRSLLDWMYVPSCIMSGLFLLAQSILLVDFAYDLADCLVAKAEQVSEGFNWFYATMLTITFASLALSVGSTVYLMIQFKSNTSTTLNILNLFLIAIMNLSSALEAVRQENPSAGIFQSAILSSYMVYLVASAFSSDPKYHASSSLTDSLGFFAVAATIISVAYSAYSTGASSHKLTSTSPNLPTTISTSDVDGGGEEEVTEYNYALYQFVFLCASLYTALMITDWKKPLITEGFLNLVDTRLSFWVKIATSWAVAALYIWSLFAPIVLTNREFY